MPSDVAPPPPSSTGDTMAGEPIDNVANATAADVPLPPISDDSDIRCMLETVITVQAAH